MVDNRGKREVLGGVLENRVVPALQIRVMRNEIRKRLPLVRRSDDAGAVSADVGRLRVGGLERIFGPCQVDVVRIDECRGSESSRVSLRRRHGLVLMYSCEEKKKKNAQWMGNRGRGRKGQCRLQSDQWTTSR